MKFPVVFSVLLALVVSASAQVTARRALQPLYKDGALRTPSQQVGAKPAPAPAPAAAPAPTPVAARTGTQASGIEPDLKPSKISLFGKIEGLSGTFFVTNVGNRAVAPFAQLAVLDKNGKVIGWATNSASVIQPKESEKIQILATNANAVDLKIVRLTGHKK
jgi:hypothetical protein